MFREQSAMLDLLSNNKIKKGIIKMYTISSNNPQNNNNTSTTRSNDDDEEVPLPGFRFHPTDEELVGFYLRQKVDKKPISLELIKQIDIYKHDPWDLPRPTGAEDKEGYFFCKRGRKYRNSIRPNRVTKFGFWKATGIDKPVYSNRTSNTIGLKKTLVYYRGSAGKGTKTDWMMHEFRLPAASDLKSLHLAAPSTTTDTTSTDSLAVTKNNSTQDAEVWTLCRIFKRNASNRKYAADWRQLCTKQQQINNASTSTSSESNMVNSNHNGKETYFSFSGNEVSISQFNYNLHQQQNDKKAFLYNIVNVDRNQLSSLLPMNSATTNMTLMTTTPSMALSNDDVPRNHHQGYGANDDTLPMYDEDWDELRSAVDQFTFSR